MEMAYGDGLWAMFLSHFSYGDSIRTEKCNNLVKGHPSKTSDQKLIPFIYSCNIFRSLNHESL